MSPLKNAMYSLRCLSDFCASALNNRLTNVSVNTKLRFTLLSFDTKTQNTDRYSRRWLIITRTTKFLNTYNHE